MNGFYLKEVVERALYEDLGRGDITTAALASPRQRAHAIIRAKQDGVIAGLDVARSCFNSMATDVTWQVQVTDGQFCQCGDVIVTMEGPALALLGGERVALNFLQRMSGIATATRAMVEAVAGYGARVVDTRKTVPGLRTLDKYAVRMGGGANHRFGLDDGVLIKDNHITLAGGIAVAIERIRHAVGHMVKIEVEVVDLDQLELALAAGVDAILLDNMSLATMHQAVTLTQGRCLLEASGNITLDNCRSVAETGVNLMSVGALTHSAQALDLTMIVTVGGVVTDV